MSIDCTICGKKDPKHIWRCEEHYRCDACGTRDGLVFRRGGVMCDECHGKRAAKEIQEFKGNTDFTDEITCPWCGSEQGDSWEASDSGEHECDNCGHPYSHEREVSATYGTKKILSEPTGISADQR